MSHDVELDRLCQRTALSNGDNISLLNGEAGAAMRMNVLVTLLITLVLGDVVEVVTTNDNGALHLGGDDETLEDLSTDGNISSEGALLVDVVSLDGSIGGLNAKADILHPAHGLDLFGVDVTLACNENGILALVSLFVLYREPPPHDN